MACEPSTPKSQLESLSWLERSGGPETQVIASWSSLRGSAVHCFLLFRWKFHAARSIFLQSWEEDWGALQPLWLTDPGEHCCQVKGRQEKFGEADNGCLCFTFKKVPSPHPLSHHHLMEHFSWLSEPGWQTEHGAAAFLHQPYLFLLWCNPLHFSFHPAGGCLCNIHKELGSSPWALLRHHKSMHFSALQALFFAHKSMKCAIAHGCKLLWVPRHTLFFCL